MKNVKENQATVELTANEREVEQLQILLANYQLYYQNLRNFHWNVRGRAFFELHAKFEELYNDANEKVDELAERILTLDGHPLGNFSDYVAISTIQEANSNTSGEEMVQQVVDAHEILIEKVRNVIAEANENDDEGTLDILPAYISYLEKINWMLKAYLK
ncbi:Dps family protein [Marinifilum caeruleilacunae]|jgi:starvation-inducible DNA-binding protein|uniref:DNA starvation/stationary phase protection protein n=1 Tax=Marinifilum caeruleilacunae TaxID=2499076 RepID=A0ABX1WY10_9BACT|nr:DNA starvation/stationary phase protection protein [Marinifilum caeruleilacunae]NOU61023.1 DNA starvation/stationary phase protection protein [Marinifilum caeruleilacunae]